MGSRLSGIERFIIILSEKKNFLTPKKIMNRSTPLRHESIKILLFFKKT